MVNSEYELKINLPINRTIHKCLLRESTAGPVLATLNSPRAQLTGRWQVLRADVASWRPRTRLCNTSGFSWIFNIFQLTGYSAHAWSFSMKPWNEAYCRASACWGPVSNIPRRPGTWLRRMSFAFTKRLLANDFFLSESTLVFLVQQFNIPTVAYSIPIFRGDNSISFGGKTTPQLLDASCRGSFEKAWCKTLLRWDRTSGGKNVSSGGCLAVDPWKSWG